MSTNRYGLRFYALGGGFFCISLAAFVQGVLPMLEPESRTDKVTKVVRTDLGELKWMQHRASDYTPLELRGRAVYTREGCWYCHSQYVRPVTGETRRWGPVTQAPNKEHTGAAVTLLADTEDLRGLVAYLQKLGTNRGKWRDRFEPQLMEASQVTVPRSEEWTDHGKRVYERRCLGCHGVKGDGNGPAAAFMQKDRPRNFTLAVFKFRLTPSGSLPDEGDLLRTITRGVRGTAMPSWHELPEKDRLAVIQYIKYELAVDRSSAGKPYLFFVEEPPKAPIYIPAPPKPSVDLVRRGQTVWKDAKC